MTVYLWDFIRINLHVGVPFSSLEWQGDFPQAPFAFTTPSQASILLDEIQSIICDCPCYLNRGGNHKASEQVSNEATLFLN